MGCVAANKSQVSGQSVRVGKGSQRERWVGHSGQWGQDGTGQGKVGKGQGGDGSGRGSQLYVSGVTVTEQW